MNMATQLEQNTIDLQSILDVANALPNYAGLLKSYIEGTITDLVLPSDLTSVGENAFLGCSSLATVTFEGTPTSIASTAFSTSVLTINVPWAEGTVADAPWGATNATINYNYTEE